MPTKLTKERGKKMDVQNVLETPAFESLNSSAIATAPQVAPVDVGNVSIATSNDLAPIESGKGAMVDTVA